MKKTLLAIVLFLVSVPAFAQLTTTGVTHTIADAYIGAGDSAHYMGIVNMNAAGRALDSIRIRVVNEDTMSYRVRLLAVGGPFTLATDTGSVVETGGIAGGQGKVAAAQTIFPFHNILAGIKAKCERPLAYKVYVIVRATESAMASRGKRFTVTVDQYVH